MKQITFYIGLMCLFAGWCTSCSNDNETGIGDNTPILLSAQATDGLQVRSTIADGQPLLQNMEVGVYISENGTNTPIGSNLHYKANASGGLVLQTGTQPYYPSSGRAVNIQAYYPYNGGTGNSFDFSVRANQSSDDDYNASDLLYSIPDSYNRQVAAHPLPFAHKMARITYKLEKGNSNPTLSNAVVSILDVKPTAVFNRSTGVVGDAKGTATSISSHANGAIVVPQTIAAGTRLIKVSVGGNNYYYNQPDKLTLESGKSYNFKITVDDTELKATYTVSDWKNGTITDNGGNVTAYTYHVGDYYPDPNVDLKKDAEKAKIKGVVFWVDPASNGQHGKIVGLDEEDNLMWNKWTGNYNAKSTTNGIDNMRGIYNTIKGDPNWSAFEAYEWVHAHNNAAENYNDANATGVWYLPAVGELQHLYCAYNGAVPVNWEYTAGTPPGSDLNARSTFNEKLKNAGGTAFSNVYYWSSSEFETSDPDFVNRYVWSVFFTSNKTTQNSKNATILTTRYISVF